MRFFFSILTLSMMVATASCTPTSHIKPGASSPRNVVFMSPFGGYSPVNYHKKVQILDRDRKGVSTRPGDLSFPLVDLIRRSKKTIDIACYLYGIYTPEHTEIANACERGVKVRLFLDPSIKDKHGTPIVNEVIERFREDKLPIPVKIIDPKRAEKLTGLPFKTMHEKFGIVDGKHVFTGSANIELGANVKYTEDRFFFLDNPEAVKEFQGEFDRLWDKMGQWVYNPDEERKKDELPKK
jgi:phosphatidylserine/phosphatidylglycerophosphate/cardiolipin synthase-like enzyme